MSDSPGRAEKNAFVTQLIRLQQDGKESISGPSNWSSPPLLEIVTEDEEAEVQALLDGMVPDGDAESPGRGRWHWLIGSPGNGKSTRLGLVARRLLERGYEIVTPGDGVPIDQLPADRLPYVLEAKEPGKKYRFAYLVNDASVVKEPFGETCDPAMDLAEVLEDAARRGVSLLLSTNWGVLQRLFDCGHTNTDVRSKPWFRAVREAVRRPEREVIIETDSRKAVFSELAVSYEYLDNSSLLVNSDVLHRLIERAVSSEDWSECERCHSQVLCPFKANRDDLASPEHRGRILDILRRAEVLSGQIVVFREAVALLSLFLAGCPDDYGTSSPCDWVHERVGTGRVFDLLARRVPNLLFGSSRPYGLETSMAARQAQVGAIGAIRNLLEEDSIESKAIAPVLERRDLSPDVGVERLLGGDGMLPRLDPALEPRHVQEIDTFFAEATDFHQQHAEGARPLELAGLGQIELNCINVWHTMLQAIEMAVDPVQGQDLYFWLKRWQSTCLAWIAGVVRGLTAFQPELEKYLEFLDSSGGPAERLRTMTRLEDVLESLLGPRQQNTHGGTRLELATSMWLAGRWPEAELRPRLEHDEASDCNAIKVKMGENLRIVVTAENFTWFKRKHDLKLSDLSFNPEILDAFRRAQAQAAAASDYSVIDDDVAIVVLDEEDREHRFARTRGYLLGPEVE